MMRCLGGASGIAAKSPAPTLRAASAGGQGPALTSHAEAPATCNSRAPTLKAQRPSSHIGGIGGWNRMLSAPVTAQTPTATPPAALTTAIEAPEE